MKIDELLQCSFHNWYNKFKKVTAKSIILPLPNEFTSYLLKDGIILPKSSETVFVQSNVKDESDDEEKWEMNSDDDEPEAPYFPEFDEKINDAIEKLDGKVFPKLNWSSPRDASWIGLNNSCCCTNVFDIYLLLKSSDFIMHDLSRVHLCCDDYATSNSTLDSANDHLEYYLILRKWMEIDPATEFRCFVKEGSLIAISQREHSLYFDYIEQEEESIISDIMSFFNEHVKSKFPLINYIFDVYRKKKDTVYLIDFNPFDQITDSLLFEWNELVSLHNSKPEFRFVYQNSGVQPHPRNRHAIPQDIVDIVSGNDCFKFIDLLKLETQEQADTTSSDDDDI